MPVKIRCRNCEKVLSAPDKARGKAIQCPGCGTKLKVPAGEAPVKKKAAKAKAAPLEGEDFLARMNLDEAEHEEERVCPFCAAEMDEEEAVCRSCGMNVETGQMDAREAKKRARKGPDPALFYSKAWSDSFQFVKEHWGMALRTGWYMGCLSVLASICAFMVGYCQGGPTKFFWGVLYLLSSLGITGWFWFLSFKVIESTMTRDEKMLERINFDFFQTIALGLRFVIWPVICLGPLVVIFPFLFWFYPLATVHMTQKYTYKAWIFWEMLKVGVKNIGPAFYYFIIGFVVSLPVLVVALPMAFVIGPTGNPFTSANIGGVTNGITAWFIRLIGETSQPGDWIYSLVLIPLNLIAAFLVMTPIYLVAGFPALFMMRVNGLLGYYNYERLDLVNRIYPNTPANFWVRVLAHLIDLALWPLSSVLVVKEKKAIMVGWLLNGLMFVSLMWLPDIIKFFVLPPLWIFYNLWMYFAVSESTTTRTTIGKDAFGLIVNDLNDKQITLGKATMRVLGRMACVFTFGLGYLFAAFHPQKRGLHDLIAGTKCCWRGDR
jgi:uncharacterized RDD family membrane protein YckC